MQRNRLFNSDAEYAIFELIEWLLQVLTCIMYPTFNIFMV